MDWLTQYWPYLIAAGLVVVLVARMAVVLLPKYRQPVRHSGERTIRVIGVGGAGGNAVNHMIRAKQRGVDYIAVNTDAQVLDDSLAERRVQIGAQLTQGLGAGGDAAIGRQAAEEDAEEIGRMVSGADLVFIAAGLGGGTGSGAAPVIAAQARKAGALTVGVVTRPFEFEGVGRRKIADAAAAELKTHVDTLLLIENERVLSIVGEDTSMLEAFTVVNDVLAGTVRAVVDIMTVPGLINLDFADVRAIMQDGGTAMAGIGAAVGPERAVAAAQAAVGNPLLNHDLAGAGAILLNVAGASGMTMREVTRAAEVIRSAADPDAMIIFGTIFDDHLDDELRVTVIATRLRDEFAFVSRVASDAQSIATIDEPAPAAAVQAVIAAAAAVQPEAVQAEEEVDEKEAPHWVAIPIVTSEDEPVAVVASGASATADLEYAPEPFAPWAASQAYAGLDEPSQAEESASPTAESWLASADEAPEPVLAEQSLSAPAVEAEIHEPAEQSLAAPADEAEVDEPEPRAAAVFAPSEPDEAVPKALAEQSWPSPAEEAEPAEAEPADQYWSEPAEEGPEPGPWAAAAALAATTFAQSDPADAVSEPADAVSELEPVEEPAPSEPALSAQPYEALHSGRWSAAAALATTFAQSKPDDPVSELEPDEEPEPAAAGQAWFDPADDAPEPTIAGQPWFAPADEAEATEPAETASSAEPAQSAEPDESPEPEPLAVAEVLAPAEAKAVESAPEPEPPAAVAEVAAPEPEAVESAPEPEPLAAFVETSPSEPLADETQVEPTAAARAAEPAPETEPERSAAPPWYDPGDEALEAARSAADPAFMPPDVPSSASEPQPSPSTSASLMADESVAQSAPSQPPEAPVTHQPSKIAVSGKATARTPEPPPSQLARRTTQAVIVGVWKRLQKPPEPPR